VRLAIHGSREGVLTANDTPFRLPEGWYGLRHVKSPAPAVAVFTAPSVEKWRDF